MARSINIKCYEPINTRVMTSPNFEERARSIKFEASHADFPENYVDSVTILNVGTVAQQKAEAKAAIKVKIKDYIEQNITPWVEYTETI